MSARMRLSDSSALTRTSRSSRRSETTFAPSEFTITPSISNYTLTSTQAGGVLPGLEALALLDRFLIQQEYADLERSSRFLVYDPAGNLLYVISGESGFFLIDETIYALNPAVGYGIVAVRVENDRTLTVSSNFDGRLLGTATKDGICCSVRYSVYDPYGNMAFFIGGKGGGKFDVMSPNGMGIGFIAKMYSGPDPGKDRFEVAFPMDLAVEMKAVLMGAALMIDITKAQKNKKSRKI